MLGEGNTICTSNLEKMACSPWVGTEGAGLTTREGGTGSASPPNPVPQADLEGHQLECDQGGSGITRAVLQ